MNEQEFLENRLEDQIRWHDGKSGWNNWWFKRLQVLAIVCGALVPLVVGIGDETPLLVKVLAGGLGVVVAVSTGVIGLFRFQELWIDYRVTAEALRGEKFRYETKVPPYDSAEAFSVLVDRVENLLDRQNVRWRKQQDNSQPKAESPPAD